MNDRIATQDVERFRSFVAGGLGLVFDDARTSTLAEALRGRVAANGGNCEAYLQRLAGEGAAGQELRQIARELTVTETYFYRGADQIRAFVELVLPQQLAACGELRKVRILSAGCASGDEPYSLAMAIRESIPGAAGRVSITALDVNPAMLEKARRARYTSWSLRELPDELRARWFRANGAGYALDDALRQAVTFADCNLVQEEAELWRPQSWDVVFCRNVLMYFDPTLAQAVVARIARTLPPGGHLFLGHAETLRGLSNDFHLCHTHGTFYYCRREGAPEPEITAPAAQSIARAAAARLDDAATWVEAVRRATERIDALADASRDLTQAPAAQAARGAPDLRPTLELLRDEKFEQALAQLGALPLEHAREPDVLLLRAVSAAHSGALTQAECACRELLALDELSSGAHYVLALCREGCGDFNGALDEDRVALHLDPGFAMARLHLGLLARRHGDRDTAIRELERALRSLLREDASRLLLFGGGFRREALVALCRAEIGKCGGGA